MTSSTPMPGPIFPRHVYQGQFVNQVMPTKRYAILRHNHLLGPRVSGRCGQDSGAGVGRGTLVHTLSIGFMRRAAEERP
jgi:hypothetical protein